MAHRGLQKAAFFLLTGAFLVWTTLMARHMACIYVMKAMEPLAVDLQNRVVVQMCCW